MQTEYPTPTLPYDPNATPEASPLEISESYQGHILVVQGYNIANTYGIIDYAFVFFIFAIVLLSIWRIISVIRRV